VGAERPELDPAAQARAQSNRLQEEALPAGGVVVSCPAPYAAGGLGRHLEEIMQALERRGEPGTCICNSTLEPERGPLAHLRPTAMLAPVMRFSPAGRMWTGSVRFDGRAARALAAGGKADHLVAFNGTALAQFSVARRMGTHSLALMSANSHMRRVIRQHEIAHRQYPIERPWSKWLLGRNVREYSEADQIYVASRYVWESFNEEGISDSRLAFFPLTAHPRYEQAGRRDPPRSGTFNVVYAGSLVVHKGVPLLIDAFRRLEHSDMRLVLVGGWKTPNMRRFIERSCAQDTRISVRPGDPLEQYLNASLCVHPSYEDGFAYAAAEALACGVPVLVSQDTGAKDLVDPGVTGEILPTGDVDALATAMDDCYRGVMLGG
jgi:glycosyltransferase involved in cell wall biosynthesis